MTDITLTCDCGQVQLSLAPRPGPSQGNRLICHCKSCQAYPRLLGHPEVLDAGRGIDITQVSADRVALVAGAERIGALRVTPKGVFRWYATCCNSPLCTTLPDPRWGLIGLVSHQITEPERLGPVKARVQIPKGMRLPEGLAPTQGRPFAGMARAIASVFAWRLAGRGRNHPLYPGGQPLAEPRLVPRDKVEAARA